MIEVTNLVKHYGDKKAVNDISFTINDGERVAQAVVARCEQVEWDSVEELSSTERGEGGFGSTGK